MADVATPGAEQPTVTRSGWSPNRKVAVIGGIFLALILVVVIAAVEIFSSHLENAKSGTEIGTANITDGIEAVGTVNKVDPVTSQMTFSLVLTPTGTLDASGGLLAAPISLYYDGASGTKVVNFAADEPLGSLDLTLPLEGSNVGSYPWDNYTADVQLSFRDDKTGSTLPVDLQVHRNVPAYNVVDVTGSVDTEGVISAHFQVGRAASAVAFSMLVTIIMWGLALGVAFMALSVILRRRKFELAMLAMMAAVLFAMPAALRSFQPGIPAPGVLSDFYGFIPCDGLVAVSLISMIAVYLIRKPA